MDSPVLELGAIINIIITLYSPDSASKARSRADAGTGLNKIDLQSWKSGDPM